MRGPTCNILHHALPPKLLTYDSNSSRRSYIRMFAQMAHLELRTRKCIHCVACLSISWFGHGGAWYTLTFVVGCRRIELAGDIAGIVPSGELEGIL